MSRPTCRPQLKRNKCSRVGASNRRVIFTTVKTSVQEHPGQFQTIAVHCISTSNDSGTLINFLLRRLDGNQIVSVDDGTFEQFELLEKL